MKAKTLKELIVVVIALLIISEIFSWLYEVIQSTYGLIIAVVVFAVYTYFGIKARERASTTTLFLMPALLCSMIPIGIRVYNFFTGETSLISSIIQSLPFIISFVLPILFLVIIYFNLNAKGENS